MEREAQDNQIRKKYFTALIGLLILTILIAIKPAVNNIITDIYYWISFVGVCLITFFVTSFRFYESKAFANKIFGLSDFLSLFIVTCCIFQFIFVFGYFKADVDGVSMNPTLRDENVLIVRSSNNNLENFDIVIVQYSKELNVKTDLIADGELLVKRLIAKGGDVFNITDGVLFLNGQVYSEDYAVYKQHQDSQNPNFSKFVGKGLTYDEKYNRYIVDQGYCFVMGDNRDNSIDSRMIGLIKEEQIIGRVDYRVNALFDWERLS